MARTTLLVGFVIPLPVAASWAHHLLPSHGPFETLSEISEHLLAIYSILVQHLEAGKPRCHLVPPGEDVPFEIILVTQDHFVPQGYLGLDPIKLNPLL